MQYMDNKGNAVAVILVVVAIVVVLAVSTQYTSFVPIEPLIKSNQKIQSETLLTIDEAIELGTKNFLKNGFSSKSNVWYYNTPLVPDLNHVDNSYNFLVNSSIGQFLDNSSLLGGDYLITSYSVDVNAFIPTDSYAFDKLNDDRVDFDVNVFASSKDGSKILKAPNSAHVYYSVWSMYKKLFNWQSNDPNFFGKIVTSAVELSVPAVMSSCSCDKNDMLNPNFEKQNCKDKKQIIYSLINSQLEKKINELNNSFSSSQVVCKFQITNYEYDCNDVRRGQHCIYNDTATAAYKCLSKAVKTSNVQNFVEWSAKKSSDPQNSSLKTALEVQHYPGQENLFSSNFITPESSLSSLCPEGAIAKEVVLSLNPQIFVEAKVTCIDNSQIVALLGNQENLKAEIVLKVAAKRDVNPPKEGIYLSDSLETTCAGGGGGGPGSGGGDSGCVEGISCTDLSYRERWCFSNSDPCDCNRYHCLPSWLTPFPTTNKVGWCFTNSNYICDNVPSEGCVLHQTVCDGSGSGLVHDELGNVIFVDPSCCESRGGGTGPDPGCVPENTCFEVDGVMPNCIQTPKDCAALSPCNTGECDPSLAEGCVKKPITDDNNKCTIDRCDDSTGTIKHDPVICTDNDPPCIEYTCNETNGECELKNEIICAMDNNYCTEEKCISSEGGCVKKDRDCGISTVCYQRDCNSFAPDITAGEMGKCQVKEKNCNDNNGCTMDSCSPSIGCQNNLSCPSTSYNNCGVTACDSNLDACVIQDPINCTQQPNYLMYTPNNCYWWNNTCANGTCSNKPVPKCNAYLQQYCYTTDIELSIHGCTSLESSVENCCYTAGQ